MYLRSEIMLPSLVYGLRSLSNAQTALRLFCMCFSRFWPNYNFSSCKPLRVLLLSFTAITPKLAKLVSPFARVGIIASPCRIGIPCTKPGQSSVGSHVLAILQSLSDPTQAWQSSARWLHLCTALQPHLQPRRQGANAALLWLPSHQRI